MNIREYVKVDSLEQAYQLNQKKSNRIIGGMLWMKMGDHRIQTAIDMSGLGLDTIEETEDTFVIGSMVTLRQIELHEGLNHLTEGMMRESVRSIVGVQFRNLATVGGSLFGRFGFSDVLTMFLAMDTSIELYKGGIIPLEEFITMPADRDILVRIIVKKTPMHCIYQSYRNSKTDFPVLTCAVVGDTKGVRIAVGARPSRAVLRTVSGERLTSVSVQELAEELGEGISMGSNMRAGAEYRTHLAKVMIRRALTQILEVDR